MASIPLCLRGSFSLDSKITIARNSTFPRPVSPNRTAPVPHSLIPTFRILALGVAVLTSGMIGARSAAAEATLVVEADTGKVLHAEHATYPWYPASTTKLMTMYLVLKAVKDGRLNLDTLLTVSSNAVAQAPSKMGFKAGTTVTVDNALKMMMVKSANDIAVVLAEGVSGSIEKFADDMNAASRRLGMTQSSWVNPNGLPADEQITSARDMAILARAVLRELPEYELYWHIPAIKFGRRVMRNTNGLIDRYPGADGMKTGFICASGFNVVATATRGGRKLIVVVFGSSSGAVRSEKAAQLFEKGFASGGLSWLMPTLGTVDALQPIAAAPPNLRDDMCGKHRRRPAAESADDDDDVQASTDVDSSSAYAVSANALRERTMRGPLLGPLVASMPPIPVFVGSGRKSAEPAQVATTKRKKKPDTATAAVSEEPKAAPKTAPKIAPATVNAAAGFSLSPAARPPSAGTFTPASAKETPVATPPKQDASAAKRKTAAKPESKAEARPAAKPDAKSKTAAKPNTKSSKQ
jgi:D-alanyl-D-alanine carboxypeptidase